MRNVKQGITRIIFVVIACLNSPFLNADTKPETLRVDGERLNATMQKMKTFGGNAAGGSDRIAFSEHNKAALAYLKSLMENAGMKTRVDVAGNLIGRRPGQNEALAPIITGSHIDTVINGGHYDGIVGVMAAIEVAQRLADQAIALQHPLEVIVWTNEEAGKTGSRSYAGVVQEKELSLTALGQTTIGDGLRFLGGDPDRLAVNKKQPGDVTAYIELHIEQGAELDRKGLDIGVVDGIVGIKRWNVDIQGVTNHAGTTPMDQRQDALLAAAELIVATRRVITTPAGQQVGTVGRLHVEPGAPNVIPGKVSLSLEIRDLAMAKIDKLFADIQAEAATLATQHQVEIAFSQYYESLSAVSDPRISALVAEAADNLGLTRQNMPSGAGHDAQSFKAIAPLGMIFVPSKDGISHAPNEFTAANDITNGANVLLNTLIAMDQLFPSPASH